MKVKVNYNKNLCKKKEGTICLGSGRVADLSNYLLATKGATIGPTHLVLSI